MLKKHLHTSNLWNIILNNLVIKALTLDVLWHNLDKNYIDSWPLLMYIHMQKNKLLLNEPSIYKCNMIGPRSLNMKLQAQNQLNTSISFEIKFSFKKVSLGMPGHIKSHLPKSNQFITLIDVKLHAQSQLYLSFCFQDCKVLITSLVMPGHAWLCLPKTTSSIFSFNRHVHTCKKSTL